jgi:hypothetical protein
MSRAGFRYAMSNPGALLIAGNPSGKRTSKRKPSRKNPTQYQTKAQSEATTARIVSAAVAKARALDRRSQVNKVAAFLDMQQIRAARERAALKSASSRSNPRKSVMAKKKRTAAQRAATARMIAANKAGKRSRRKSRRASRPAVTRRESKAIRRRARAVKHYGKRALGRKVRVHNVPASKGTVVVVRRVARGTVRRAKRRSGFPVRAFRVNPVAGGLGDLLMGPYGLIGSFKHVGANFKAVSGGGIKSMAIAAAAGAGSIVLGTMVKATVVKVAMKVAPVWSAGAVGARVLTGVSYYGTGWAVARFATKDPRTKSAILAGTVVATVLELFRPGTVTDILAKLPIVGDMFGKKIAATVKGIDADLGAYVEGELGAYVEGYQEQALGYDNGNMDPSVLDARGYDDSLEGYNLQGYNLQGMGIGCDDDSE